jgi:tRNA (cytidine/uridine-2'-O-)-methyltransferase
MTETQGTTSSPESATPRPALHIVLLQPEIAPNAGAIGRTCVAVGAKLWMVRPLGFQISDRHLRRAGMDYWKHLDWEVVDDWDDLLRRLPGRDFWLVSKTGHTLYRDVRFVPGDVLVFGSESQGLPPSLLAGRPERCLRIPMQPVARSLNVSVSVGIIAYEALRQIESV